MRIASFTVARETIRSGLSLRILRNNTVTAERGGVLKGLLDLLLTSLVYSIILVIIYRIGILKPVKL